MELVERVRKAREYEEALYGELRDHPIDLDDLFDAVVKTIHYNYVGYEHKKQYFTPAEYHTYVFSHYRYGTLTVEMLVRSLHQFAGDMHDRHLTFYCDDWIDYRNLAASYRVRASKDVLYVTQADPDTGLVPGDKILKVQGMTPEKVRRLTRHNCFFSREPERELWGGYLRMAQSLTVEHADGSQETMKIKLSLLAEQTLTIEEQYPVLFAMYPDSSGASKTAYIRLERMHPKAINDLCAEHSSELENADKLILDLRRCIGGEEGAGWNLFPLLLDHEEKLSNLIADEGSYVLCTRNNCDIRLSLLKSAREQIISSLETEKAARPEPDSEMLSSYQEQLAIIDDQIRFYKENYAKGLIFAEPEPIEDEVLSPAAKAPGKIVILLDTFCENEGEQFAAMCRRCGSKVQIAGRPSMGTLDYYDPIRLKVHEHMILSYPIRMTKAAFEGRGISEKGIQPDIYIPWTPEEIERDVIRGRFLD